MYQMNEGTLAIPADWRDESLHVFVLPGMLSIWLLTVPQLTSV